MIISLYYLIICNSSKEAWNKIPSYEVLRLMEQITH